ncbi:MAG: polyprenyl synthetase family protein [Candidatus Diapherotrites archaeon]|nr:polyprenyl synthetase family protein [Candidatus Diapherotrites archaeon]
MDVKTILAKRKRIVQREMLKQIGSGKPKILWDMMKDYPQRGGKFLRPALIMITCEAFGGKPKKATLTAAAYEMFQDWILIHDDIEDKSDERRGKPCLHKMHGIPLAINAGDALHGLMWRTLLKNKKVLGEKKTLRVMEEFADVITKTTMGQTMELYWVENNIWDVSEKDYYKMIGLKTSPYTITHPCRLGAIIAGKSEKTINAFNAFGDALGKAFQIQDDVLNLIADESKYGKEIAGDLYEGKRTLILIHLLRSCTKSEREKVIKILSKRREDKKKSEIRYILRLMHSYGSIDYAVSQARRYAVKAKRLFNRINIPEGRAKKELEAIIDFVVEREL